jgi:hypothetical protein
VLLEGRRYPEGVAELAHVHCVCQSVFAQKNDGQVVRQGTEAGNAEAFPAQFFHSVDFRLNPKPVVGAAGHVCDGHNGSSFCCRTDDCASGGQPCLQVAAQ